MVQIEISKGNVNDYYSKNIKKAEVVLVSILYCISFKPL